MNPTKQSIIIILPTRSNLNDNSGSPRLRYSMTILPMMHNALTKVNPPIRKSKYVLGFGNAKMNTFWDAGGSKVEEEERIRTRPAKVIPPRKVRTRMA